MKDDVKDIDYTRGYEFNKNKECSRCGERGAYDMGGMYYCFKCVKYYSGIPND